MTPTDEMRALLKAELARVYLKMRRDGQALTRRIAAIEKILATRAPEPTQEEK